MSTPEIEIPAAAAPLGRTDAVHNWTLGHDGLVVEIMNTATADVWLCQRPMTRSTYESIPLPEGFVRSGIGGAVADAAYFRRSPGAAADGDVDTMTVGDHVFSFVARPGEREPGFDNAFVLAVDKHHSMWFAAGRTIDILDMGDGHVYIPQTTSSSEVGGRQPGQRVLADSWSIRHLTLTSDLLVEVPNPARVCFFHDGSSFQGPLDLELA